MQMAHYKLTITIIIINIIDDYETGKVNAMAGTKGCVQCP